MSIKKNRTAISKKKKRSTPFSSKIGKSKRVLAKKTEVAALAKLPATSKKRRNIKEKKPQSKSQTEKTSRSKNEIFRIPGLEPVSFLCARSVGVKKVVRGVKMATRFVCSPQALKDVVATVLMVGLIGGQFFGIFGMPQTASAATYTFTQSNWGGGATASSASHGSNQTGWTQYASKDATTTIANAGEDVQIVSTASSTTQTSTAEFNAAVSSSNVTVSSGSVSLTQTGTANQWTTLTAVPGAVGDGGAMIHNSGENYIYVTQGNNGTGFYRYSISGNTWSPSVSQVPTALGNGSAMNRYGSGDYIYVVKGNYSNVFYRYSISGDAWTTRATLPNSNIDHALVSLTSNGSDGYVYAGISGTFGRYDIANNSWTTLNAPTGLSYHHALLRYGSEDYIYAAQGGYSTVFNRYSISGASWTTLSPMAGSLYHGGQTVRYSSNDYIYTSPGNAQTNFQRYSISGGTWSNLSAIPASLDDGSSMLTDGTSVFAVQGGNTTGFYKYSISGSTWSPNPAQLPGATGNGSAMIRDSIGDLYVTQGGGGTGFYKYSVNTTYYSSGTLTSSVIDMGQVSAPTTLAYTATTPSGTSLTVDVRAGNTATPDGTWTSYVTSVANGGSLSALSGYRYLQYRVNFSGDTISTPTLSDVTINFGNYENTNSVTLTSSKYDTSSAGNLITKVTWTGSGTSTTELIKVQVRSASTANGLDSAPWCGYADTGTCTGSNYFLEANNGVALASNHPLRNGDNDQYLQYKITLVTGGTATPSVGSIAIQYVVNASPDFDATYGTNGLSISVSTTTGATWGLATISYRVRDADTTSGSATRGLVTPSFEYSLNGGSSWSTITSGYLASGDLSNKAVNETSYTTYTATWNPVAQLGTNTYVTNAKIRVTVNDNEPALNTTQSTSAAFTLDTKSPAASSFLLDGSSATSRLKIVMSDDSQIKDYQISNNSDLTSDGNGLSGSWQTATSTSFALTRDWTLATSSTVTAVFRDIYGNISTSTAVAPATPDLMELKDISSPANDTYREFLAWTLYPSSVSGATFDHYELVRSTDGSTYSALATISSRTTNFYSDMSLASTTTYYYKVRVVDADGDKSAYTSVVSDRPNGQGGTDTIAPTISNVVSDTIKNNSVRIGWDTDEIATSRVDYGTTAGAYGSSATSNSYVITGHELYLTGLTSNTTYYFRVKSTDVSSNVGTSDNNGAGYTFTTAGGPVISNVTASDVSDNSATIFWNTTTPSSSYVDFGTSNTLASYTESGTATLASSTNPVQHRVVLTGLTAGTTYYYQVKSTDANSNTSIDTNSGTYYRFVTTYDTKAPTISSVSSPVQSANAAVIVWTTDELATSQVEYGTIASTTSGSYPNVTQSVATPTIFHVVTLSSETTKIGGGNNELTKSTRYYYRVKSTDQAGNAAVSDEYSALTTQDGSVVVVNVTSGGGGGGSGEVIDRTAPIISGITVSTTTAFGALIKFDTSKATRGTVQYGTDTTYENNTGETSFYTTHSVSLKGLRMGTVYHFKIAVIDKNGNTAESSDTTFKTQMLAEDLGNLKLLENSDQDQIQKHIEDIIESALPSLNPPYVDKPIVKNITEDGATVSWKTNIKSYGSIGYSTDEEYLKGETYAVSANEDDGAKTTDHTIKLANLKPNTKYHFSVKSFVFQQAPAMSEDTTFITKAASVQPQVVGRKKDEFHVVWTTDEKTTSIVEYRKVGASGYGKKADDVMTNSHDIHLENLLPATNYELKVYGYTAEGNIIEAKENLIVKTGVDITPPEIQSFKVDSALVPGRNDRTQTVVSWNTDEPATSVVHYEEGSGAPDKALLNKQEDANLSEKHVVILTNLRPGTIYRFQIESTDDSNNKTVLPVRTIITPKQSESIVDVIFKNFGETFNFLNR